MIYGIKKLTAAVLAVLLAASLCACGSEDTSESTSESGTADIIFDEDWNPAKESEGLPKMTTQYATEEMIKRSVYNEGNLSRLAHAMQKAKDGEKVTLATIGGSITQGSSASNPKEAYANKFLEWWQLAFPNAEIELHNAGIGATDSYIGVHRVKSDVLDFKPDVVVAEFSVNDTNQLVNPISYDNLVRRLLTSESNPAVILLFTTQEDGTSFQDTHSKTGKAYDLPMISYKNAVLPEIKAGSFTWKDISPDNIHPNTRGHAIIGELMCAYLNSVLEKLDDIDKNVSAFEDEPLTKDTYMQGRILNALNTEPSQLGSFEKKDVSNQFKGNWTTESGEESIIFEVDAANIGIMYYRTTDGRSGIYQVFVDGKLKGTLNGNFVGGWGNYTECTQLVTNETAGKHTVEIKKSASSEASAMSIIGLLVS